MKSLCCACVRPQMARVPNDGRCCADTNVSQTPRPVRGFFMAGGKVSPMRGRSSSRSTSSVETPNRLSAKPVAAPAGPPPTMATSTCCIDARVPTVSTPFGFDEFFTLLDHEAESMPIGDHVVRTGNDVARPGDLRPAALREHVVRTLRRPPRQLAFLRAVGKVGLPRHRHLLGHVAGFALLRVQTKRLDKIICVAQ